MPFQTFSSLGHARTRPGTVIGAELEDLARNAELIDRTIHPLLFRLGEVTDIGGPWPAIAGTALDGHLIRRWVQRVPRTLATVGEWHFQARGRYVSGSPGNVHLVVYDTDLVTVLATTTIPFTSTSFTLAGVDMVQPVNPGEWFVLAVYTEDADFAWVRLYPKEDN